MWKGLSIGLLRISFLQGKGLMEDWIVMGKGLRIWLLLERYVGYDYFGKDIEVKGWMEIVTEDERWVEEGMKDEGWMEEGMEDQGWMEEGMEEEGWMEEGMEEEGWMEDVPRNRNSRIVGRYKGWRMNGGRYKGRRMSGGRYGGSRMNGGRYGGWRMNGGRLKGSGNYIS